jgi:hypothetical protein
MPNVRIKQLFEIDLWVDYSDTWGEPEINSIYVGSDPERVDIFDLLKNSVINTAREAMHQDWAETNAELTHESWKEKKRFWDDQQGWVG